MTPTALVDDTLLRCQPDSCQASAMARSLGMPARRAKRRNTTRSPARSAGTTTAGAVRAAARVAAGMATTLSWRDPAAGDRRAGGAGLAGAGGALTLAGVGIDSVVPARTWFGSRRPLAAARAETLTP